MRVGLRSSARLAGLSLITFAGLVLLALRPALTRDAGERLRRRIQRSWSRLACRLLGIRIRVDGPAPQPPFVLVSNHVGYLDPVVLSTTVDARFVAKSDVSSWPVVGWIARLIGTLFVERRNARDLRRINQLVGAVLDDGGGVAFFPEGTSTDGRSVAAFRPGLLATAAGSGMAVHAAAIAYRVPDPRFDERRDVAWWGSMTFVDHLLNLLHIPRIEAHITFAAHPFAEGDRKALAMELHRVVESMVVAGHKLRT